ncbi:MAG: PilZ domain-containing protein [Myxococcales bacterium]|nr:PilZ domain-containing protein [Myxococcales bacterium]
MRECSASPAEFAGLALICEGVVPDAQVAMNLYCRAYASGAEEAWAVRVTDLAMELGDFSCVARVAGMRHANNGDAVHLRAQALALLDAGRVPAALAPLRATLEVDVGDRNLLALERAASGECANIYEEVRTLGNEAQSIRGGAAAADCLLSAARLAAFLPDSEHYEQLLIRALDADASNITVGALLENHCIESQQWNRLGDLYRVRAQSATTSLEKVEAYRLSGTRLVMRSESPGTGVRLLQQAVSLIYQEQLEDVPQLVAMLDLLTEQLVQSGGTPSAIRLLVRALAHPRTSDEAMWIVNRGLRLADGDVALRRTVVNFESLRENLLANEPAVLEECAAAEIGGEVRGRVKAAGLREEGAERTLIAADVSIAVRAKISTANGKASAMTRDLSETGLFMACDAELAQSDEISLSILIPGEDEWSLSEHDISGVVARVVPGVGYGVRFTNVPEQFLADVRALCG